MVTTVQQIRDAATASVAMQTATTAPDASDLASQLAAANRRIAELQATLEPVKQVGDIRIYHSSIPFIRVPIMRAPGHCTNVQFIAGVMETSDPAVIEVMEAAILAGGSGFSHAINNTPNEAEQVMRADLANLAATAHKKMVAAGEKTA